MRYSISRQDHEVLADRTGAFLARRQPVTQAASRTFAVQQAYAAVDAVEMLTSSHRMCGRVTGAHVKPEATLCVA